MVILKYCFCFTYRVGLYQEEYCRKFLAYCTIISPYILTTEVEKFQRY
jgi:hypothetical protein